MISSPAFPGANVPVSVLQTRLQQESKALQRGDGLNEANSIYGWGTLEDLQKHHASLCSLVDRLAPGQATVGDLRQACKTEYNRLNVRCNRFYDRLPWIKFGCLGGGGIALTGLAHAIFTQGAWKLGGAVGLVGGGAAAACCGWVLWRGFKMDEQAWDRSALLTAWAGKLDSPAYQSPTTSVSDSAKTEPSLHDLSREEKEKLIARLRIEIHEAEQKASAKVEQKGTFVDIGGVKLPVNRPTGKGE